MTLDDVLENWAAWHRNPEWDVNDPANNDSLTGAAAVELLLLESLHWKEVNALRAVYLKRDVKWTEASLFTAKGVIEQGLRDKKIL